MTEILQAVFAGLAVLLLVLLILNVDKLRRRLGTVVRQLKDAAESGPAVQMEEAVAQLQSISASLDRIAGRADDLDARVAEIVNQGPGGDGGAMAEGFAALVDGLGAVRAPLEEIRDIVNRSPVDRLDEEIRRTLYNLGFDRVAITSDLGELAEGDGKVQVSVEREGVKSKGYLVLKSWRVVEKKISATYEMFP